jgi:hypothetical protein
VLVALVFVTYDSYAVSNDEQVQQHYGELIVAYYRSGFTDQALFHFENLPRAGACWRRAAWRRSPACWRGTP